MAAPFQRAVTGITATKGSSCFKVLAKKRRTAKPAGPGRCDNLLRRDNRGPGELVDRLPKGRRAAVRLEKPCAIGRRMRPGRQSSLRIDPRVRAANGQTRQERNGRPPFEQRHLDRHSPSGGSSEAKIGVVAGHPRPSAMRRSR